MLLKPISMELDIESLGHMVRNGIDGSYGRLIFRFFLRIPHIGFQSGWASLQLH